MRLGKIIFHNFWAKVISLVLATAAWFYVFDMVNTDSFIQKKETAEEIFSRFKFSVKEVPVKAVFSGKSPEGYRVIFDKVKVDPPAITVFVPESMLEDVTELRTDSIDLGEYTRSTQLKVGVWSDIKFLRFEEDVVDVFLPVETVDPDKSQPEA